MSKDSFSFCNITGNNLNIIQYDANCRSYYAIYFTQGHLYIYCVWIFTLISMKVSIFKNSSKETI